MMIWEHYLIQSELERGAKAWTLPSKKSKYKVTKRKGTSTAACYIHSYPDMTHSHPGSLPTGCYPKSYCRKGGGGGFSCKWKLHSIFTHKHEISQSFSNGSVGGMVYTWIGPSYHIYSVPPAWSLNSGLAIALKGRSALYCVCMQASGTVLGKTVLACTLIFRPSHASTGGTALLENGPRC